MSTRVLPSIAAAIAASRHVARAPLGWDPADHLLSRFAFGPTAESRAWVRAHGPQAWVEQQIALGTRHPGYGAHPQIAAQGTLLGLDPYDCRRALAHAGDQYGWTAMDQLTEVTLGLQGWSPAQLYETVVDVFANHLNVPNHNGDVWITRHCFDRDVTRRYAFGRFSDMLVASARHPAMLTYLSLADSTKAAVNENYGRELLELHTVGLRYSESDVTNAARLLTGRTLDENMHYVFDDYIHPVGPVKVLGFTHPNADAAHGEAAGDALLRYLAGHRWTATTLARTLCVRFVSDTPSASLVSAVAQSYLQHHTSILAMVLTILRSTEFWESRGAKIRRPAENVLASLRAVGPTVGDWSKALPTLHWITAMMGNAPLDWPAPDGYPDVAVAWRSAGALLSLWDVHLGVAGSWWGTMTAPAADALWAGARPTTSGEAVRALTAVLTGAPFGTDALAALQGFLGEPATTPLADSALRWLGYPVMALILDAPHHALR